MENFERFLFNRNSGYVGNSRSIRSLEAINRYCVPKNYIDGHMIYKFKHSCPGLYPDAIFNCSASIWKYTADKVGLSEEHHTGKYFNLTAHYSLDEIADYLTDNLDAVKAEYQNKLADKRRKRSQPASFAFITSEVWGGTRKHPKKMDYEDQYFGFIKPSSPNTLIPYNGSKSRCSLSANIVTSVQTFGNLQDFERVAYLKDIAFTRKEFIKFLKDHNVNYKTVPDPADANEVQESASIKLSYDAEVRRNRLDHINEQRRENRIYPFNVTLRKLARAKEYDKFKSVYLEHYSDSKLNYSSVNLNVYWHFNMPKHLQNWLEANGDNN